MNSKQEMMLFSEWKYTSTLDTRQWDIQKLDKNKLTVKRYNRDFSLELETVIFERKE